jgi:hypothetical protein
VVTDLKAVPITQRLQISTAANREGAIISSGAVGKDALSALGLSPGFIGPVTADKDAPKTFGLNLSSKLNLNDADGIKAAIEGIASAFTAVRSAYKALAPSTGTITNTQTGSGSSTAYQQTQLANFQAALTRLTA